MIRGMPRKERFRNLGANKGIKQQLDPVILRRLYLDDGMSQSAIARGFSCSPQFVSQLLHEYGILPSPTPKNQ
jgi:hypothetical protein